MKLRLLILMVCISLVTAVVMAHGDEQHVIGTVTKITQDSIGVETTTKSNVEVMITSQTKFTKGEASAALKDLQVGDRVVIHAMPMKGGMLMAQNVQIGVAKTPSKSR